MKNTKNFRDHLNRKSVVSKTLEKTAALIALFLLLSCNSGPQPIDYGQDGCHFCSMTIVDKLHAAEIVTNKGKVYKFDATECMVNHLKTIDPATLKHFLSNNYLKAEMLINAKQASFLISENIPSPMGAFLSAFATKAEAETIQNQKGGIIYNWEALIKHLK